VRYASRVLAVGIEAVDAELYCGEDASGGIQLAVSHGCLYHLRYVVKDPASGAVNGGIQNASSQVNGAVGLS
jgi:hypothetical protein